MGSAIKVVCFKYFWATVYSLKFVLFSFQNWISKLSLRKAVGNGFERSESDVSSQSTDIFRPVDMMS